MYVGESKCPATEFAYDAANSLLVWRGKQAPCVGMWCLKAMMIRQGELQKGLRLVMSLSWSYTYDRMGLTKQCEYTPHNGRSGLDLCLLPLIPTWRRYRAWNFSNRENSIMESKYVGTKKNLDLVSTILTAHTHVCHTPRPEGTTNMKSYWYKLNFRPHEQSLTARRFPVWARGHLLADIFTLLYHSILLSTLSTHDQAVSGTSSLLNSK